MPPVPDDDWSDSDEEVLSEVETSVLLGVPDGPITAEADINDALVSRIGGYPALLPSKEPPFSSSHCKICANPMELLVQMWCPFEDSPMDRAMYIWGCSRSGCQKKEGSVRAWRGLRYNEKFAAKLEAKHARQREKQAKVDAEKQKQAAKSTSNPFSMNASSAPNPFGLGTQIFGEAPAPAPSVTPEVPSATDEDPDLSDSESSSSEKSLLTALVSATLDESPWKSAPSYPPIYLSTVTEYLPAQPKPKLPPGVQVVDPSDDAGGKDGKDISWAFEAYEDSLEVDHVFERFTKRVEYEGEQCVRYDLSGTPLPYMSDKTFDTLFPAPLAPPLPVTKPDFKVVPTPKRTYDLSKIPPCPACKSQRVFECQLMPNLVNVLRQGEARSVKSMSDDERRKVVEAALKGGNKEEKSGMEWGTCMVFSCEKDCRVGEKGEEERDVWREEEVLVQWDV